MREIITSKLVTCQIHCDRLLTSKRPGTAATPGKMPPFGYSRNEFRRDTLTRVTSSERGPDQMNAVISTPSAGGYRLIPADVGIGLCPEHHALVLDQQPQVAWFEVRAETLLARGDWLREVESVGRDYPLSVHSGGLSLGSVTRPDATYLGRLSELLIRLQPDLVSDHLSWSTVEGIHLSDALTSVVRNVAHVQDTLKRQILLENSFKSLDLADAALSEESFLAEVVLRTGCGVVLDLNNLHSSATELGSNANAVLNRFLEALEPESIAEIRLAGCSGSVASIDNHGSHIGAAVWELFERAIAAIGPVPTLLKWDTGIPAFRVLQAEATTARSILTNSTRQAACATRSAGLQP
jgi:uncharacterized protein (UPF0276 family)